MSDLLAARSQMAHVARLPHHLRGGGHRHAAAHGPGRAALAARPAIRSTSSWPSAGPRARRSSSRSARSRAPCSSFELGLLWPRFMAFAGPIIGMPFSLEGFAFFTEAIFLGIYLYGWDRIPPRAHLGAGILVALSGVLSGIFVVIANAWMNTPSRIRARGRRSSTNIDPIARDAEPRGVAADAAHDPRRLRRDRLRRRRRSMPVLLLRDPTNALPPARPGDRARWSARPAALLQPLSGRPQRPATWRAYQPAKLAAMEALFETRRGAPLTARRLARSTAGDARASGSRSRTGSRCWRFTTPRRGEGARSRSPATIGPTSRSSTWRFRSWWGCGTLHGARRAVGRVAALATTATCRPATAGSSGPSSLAGADGLRRDRGGLDGDRAGPPAVDHLRRAAHRGRGDADAGADRAVHSCSRCSTASSA